MSPDLRKAAGELRPSSQSERLYRREFALPAVLEGASLNS